MVAVWGVCGLARCPHAPPGNERAEGAAGCAPLGRVPCIYLPDAEGGPRTGMVGRINRAARYSTDSVRGSAGQRCTWMCAKVAGQLRGNMPGASGQLSRRRWLGVLLLAAVALLASQFLLTVHGLGQLNAALVGRISHFSMGDFYVVTALEDLQLILLLVALAVAVTSPDRALRRSRAVVIVTVVLVGLDIAAQAIRPTAISPDQLFYSLHSAGQLRDVEIAGFVVSLIAVMLVLRPRRAEVGQSVSGGLG